MPKHPLAEVFGFPPDNLSAEAERYRRNRLCPYNNKVPSCTKDKANDPLGVLSQLFLRHAEPHSYLRSAKPETKAIALIRAYLEAHYAENVSIDALAQLVGLSPYYLIRSFHRQVGLPPHGYQRHWQLLQAKRALRTSKPLSEVAIEHGFYDQSHLTRHFKRAFGVTPGQYRESNSVQDG